MFFEMMFGFIISFILGVLALAAVLAFNVLVGNLYIARTVDVEKRKADKRERKEKKREEANKKTNTNRKKTE